MPPGGGGFSSEGIVVCRTCIAAEAELSYRDLPSAPKKPAARREVREPTSEELSLLRTGFMFIFGLTAVGLGSCSAPGLMEMLRNPAPLETTCAEVIAHGAPREWVELDGCELGTEMAVLQTLTRLRLPASAILPLHAEGQATERPRLLIRSTDHDLTTAVWEATRSSTSGGSATQRSTPVDLARYRRVSGMLRPVDDIPDDARELLSRMSGTPTEGLLVLIYGDSPSTVGPIVLVSIAALCLVGFAVAGIGELRARRRRAG